jgi:valyl-tRNA synthetase
VTKPALRGDDAEEKRRCRNVLWTVLESSLRLFHPFMPFLTEEIWQAIPHEGESIMHTAYPDENFGRSAAKAEADMGLLIATVRAVRNARAELSVPLTLLIEAQAVAEDEAVWVLKDNMPALEALAKVRSLGFLERAPKDEGTVALPVAPGVDLYLPLAGVIDFDKERARITQELAAIEKDTGRLTAKLSNEGFLAKAAPEIIEKDRTLLAELKDKQAKLEARRTALGA